MMEKEYPDLPDEENKSHFRRTVWREVIGCLIVAMLATYFLLTNI